MGSVTGTKWKSRLSESIGGQLRQLALHWWKSNTRKSFLRWFFNTYPRLKQKLEMCSDSYDKWKDCLRVYLRTAVEAQKD